MIARAIGAPARLSGFRFQAYAVAPRWARSLALAAGASCLMASHALAHVSFVKRRAPVGAVIETALRVPHGCDGSPTLRLRMRLPAAVVSVRAREKAGWSASLHVQGEAREIAWSGLLPAGQTGEFPLTIELAPSVKAGDVLFFPVVQECEKGVSRWIDMKGRAAAQSLDDDAEHDESVSPAPSILILPR